VFSWRPPYNRVDLCVRNRSTDYGTGIQSDRHVNTRHSGSFIRKSAKKRQLIRDDAASQLLVEFSRQRLCIRLVFLRLAATAEQLGLQLNAARGDMSLRALGAQVGISASTLGEYERGVKVPEADKLARIAETLNCFTFRIDDFYFTVSRVVADPEPGRQSAQLPLDFSGEYSYAKAVVRIKPGRISVALDGFKTPIGGAQIAIPSNN